MIVWAFETLVATTLLMLGVLAIRSPVRRAFGPNMAYALWAIPALRMILPPVPDSWREQAGAPLAQMGETLTYYVVQPLGVPADEAVAAGPSLWPWLLTAWAVGAIGFIGYHLIAHGRFVARVRARASATHIVAAGNVAVIETDVATGPLAFGVWRKYVAFPRDFAERYDPLERDLALAHELGHHARGDLIANWAALTMLALHWFNPVAWRAFRAFRADQEMACDALVLAGRARELRHAYGRAIVKSAHGGAVSAACHLHTINEIKGRLKMLTKHEKTSRPRLMAGGATAAALLIGGLGMTASGTQAAETVRTNVEKAVGVELASLELPAIPALPVAIQATPAVPPVPPVPAAEVTETSGKTTSRTRIVVRDDDGKISEFTDESELPKGTRVIRNGMVMLSRDGKPPIVIGGPVSGKRRIMLRGKDGKTFEWEGEPGAPLPPDFAEKMKTMRMDMSNFPEVTSRDCRDDEGNGANVINRKDGDKKITIICTNRIQKMAMVAADGAAKAGAQTWVIRRNAETSALMGLRSARRSIEANRDMGEAQRASALAGIDQAIRELEAKKD